MTDIDVDFSNVSKLYRVREEAAPASDNAGLSSWLQRLQRQKKNFWAVRDVSFNVHRGEAVGIIGHNGAGKSTILKLLSSITSPTSGEITIRGRLAALIEVGSGFHPELTGRENVFLSGSILGMRRREIAEKLASIIEFAELSRFIDTPVKRYSSGMYVRLGFSIAAHLDPDILLLDEVLAVGDAAFQTKCLRQILELKRSGKSIVFISHDLNAVERLCDRTLLMQQGQLIRTGPTTEVIREYQRSTARFISGSSQAGGSSDAGRLARITSVAFANGEGVEAFSFSSGTPLTLRVQYTADQQVQNAVFDVFFYSQDGHLCCQLTTELSEERIDLEPGSGSIRFYCPHLMLLSGMYIIDVALSQRGAPGGTIVDGKFHCATLCVDQTKLVKGEFYMPHRWELTRDDGVVRESYISVSST
jgi:ABC-type polysaccharide/polyol phosphate transport system ATPase subunit